MKAKTIFVCAQCGQEFNKWAGKCSACGSWNTLYETEPVENIVKKAGPPRLNGAKDAAKPITEIEAGDDFRSSTGISELDRVLGGGIVQGSLVLVGGEPGIGKSTLLLQVCDFLSREKTVLYISGEESARQLKLRSERLGIFQKQLMVLSETRIDDILDCARSLKPEFMIVDSIQTVYNPDSTGTAGSVSQIRDCTLAFMQFAKNSGITVFLVGHVNKEGTLAGPKILEHMVDCVLYFEGDRHASYRVIRAAKNRYGSTDEIGVFEMTGDGLKEVANPSQALLSGRPKDVPGSCIACVMEGTRPILAEIQSLVTKTNFGNPRRTADGFDYNRAVLLLAVLEKRAGMQIGNCDTYINITGGLKIDEPAADLPAILSLASSLSELPLPEDMAAFGEVGLTGELRSVSGMSQRLAEVHRLGFSSCMVPRRAMRGIRPPEGLKIIEADNVREAIAIGMALNRRAK